MVGAGNEQEAKVLVFTVRETSPSETMKAEAVRAASLISSTDATGPGGGSRLEEAVFDRRVRLTVLRAAGLAQVRVDRHSNFFTNISRTRNNSSVASENWACDEACAADSPILWGPTHVNIGLIIDAHLVVIDRLGQIDS